MQRVRARRFTFHLSPGCIRGVGLCLFVVGCVFVVVFCFGLHLGLLHARTA